MSNQSGKVVLVLVLLLLILGAIIYFFSPGFKKQENPEPTPNYSNQQSVAEASKSPDSIKDYYSKNLKIGFKVPKEANIEEKFVDIIISLKNGKIIQTRIGTNFPSAREYFADLKTKNTLSPKTYEEITINGRDAILVILNDPNDRTKDQKTYFIYDHDAIYTFYSSDEALYPVLDQIVESFEYRP